MKLRNKKTGEIIDLSEGLLRDDAYGSHITLRPVACIDKNDYEYESLADFVDNWEDYKPLEPLIKDEKTRKAVRAWADANGIDESSYHKIEFDHSEHRLKWIRTIIEFDRIEGLENLDDGREYTIAELCGEEE